MINQYRLWGVLLGLALLLVSFRIPSPGVSTIVLDGAPAGMEELRKLSVGEHEIRFQIESADHLILNVDECLTGLSFNGIPAETKLPYCISWEQPLSVPVPKSVGSLIVTAKVDTRGKSGKLIPFVMKPAVTGAYILVGAGTLSLLIALWPFPRRVDNGSRKFNQRAFYLLLIIGCIPRLLHLLAETPFWTRVLDLFGHREYFEWVVATFTLPHPRQCWECYQAPLFYVTAAGISRLIGDSSEFFRSQLMFALSLTTLYLNLQSIFLCLGHWSAVIAALFVILIPQSVITETNFNNDSFVPLFSAAVLFCGLQYLKGQDGSLFRRGSLFSALGLMTKLSFLATAAWWGFCLLLTGQSRATRWRRSLTYAALVILVTGPIHFLRTDEIRIIGNIDLLNPKLSVSRDLSTFLTFDPIHNVREPFPDPWADGKHRESFFEYLFLTAIFGEFPYGNKSLAQWSIALIQLSAFAGVGLLFWNWRRIVKGNEMLLFLCGLLLVSLIVNNAIHPFSCTGTFRFISAITLPIAILSGYLLTLTPPILRILYPGLIIPGLLLAWIVILQG